MNEVIIKLEKRIMNIEKRNERVEKDKQWETSWQRRLLIAIFTYLPIGIYMWAIKIENPWLNAVVPTLGFMISTLALPFFKQIFLNVKK